MSLTQGRPEDLIHFIERAQPQGSSRNQMTIVFDGYGHLRGQEASSQMKIVFSQDKSADDKIKQLVADSSSKKTIIVVTDDRDIQYAVRALGARVWAVKEFLSKGKTILKKVLKTVAVKNISKTAEDRITSEFEKIWVKKKDA